MAKKNVTLRIDSKIYDIYRDYCKENGYEIREEYPENYYMDSNITHESLTVPELIGLREEFNAATNG